METNTKHASGSKSSRSVPVADSATDEAIPPTPADGQSDSEFEGQSNGRSDERSDERSDDQPATEPMFRDDRVRLAAYRLYLDRGGADGDPVADWLEAEAEVDSEDADTD